MTEAKYVKFNDVFSKTHFSKGLVNDLITDLKSSGFNDFSDLVGNSVEETSKNIQKKVTGFDSGKHTYLQANFLAEIIHNGERKRPLNFMKIDEAKTEITDLPYYEKGKYFTDYMKKQLKEIESSKEEGYADDDFKNRYGMSNAFHSAVDEVKKDYPTLVRKIPKSTRNADAILLSSNFYPLKNNMGDKVYFHKKSGIFAEVRDVSNSLFFYSGDIKRTTENELAHFDSELIVHKYKSDFEKFLTEHKIEMPVYTNYKFKSTMKKESIIIKSFTEFVNEAASTSTSNVATLSNIHTNRMGTASFDLKLVGMRKPQDFIVYPITKETKELTIQSDTRIGTINVSTGKGKMSQSHASGAYFHHLNFDKLTDFELSADDLDKLTSGIKKTAGDSVGSNGITTDNSGADKITESTDTKKLKIELYSKINKGDDEIGTIRTVPENYYVATIMSDETLKFDSVEANTKNIDQAMVTAWFKEEAKNIKLNADKVAQIVNASNLRSVKVTYDNGDVVNTNMAAGLSDDDIKKHFRIGKLFNLGHAGGDLMAKVKSVEILK